MFPLRDGAATRAAQYRNAIVLWGGPPYKTQLIGWGLGASQITRKLKREFGLTTAVSTHLSDE